jgi:hypothetical protein
MLHSFLLPSRMTRFCPRITRLMGGSGLRKTQRRYLERGVVSSLLKYKTHTSQFPSSSFLYPSKESTEPPSWVAWQNGEPGREIVHNYAGLDTEDSPCGQKGLGGASKKLATLFTMPITKLNSLETLASKRHGVHTLITRQFAD